MEQPLFMRTPEERRRDDRRQRWFSVRLHERRSGFDRRRVMGGVGALAAVDGFLLGLRDRPKLIFSMLVVVNALNLADFLLTLNVLSDGGGEANPIMRSLFAINPIYACIFKMFAVGITSWLAWRCRRFRSGLQSALILLAVFAAVICYHIFGLLVCS